METLSQWVDRLAQWLTTLGVPEAQSATASLALIFVLATLVVLALIVALFRLGRGGKKPPTELPPLEEERLAEAEAEEEAEAEAEEEEEEEEEEEIKAEAEKAEAEEVEPTAEAVEELPVPEEKEAPAEEEKPAPPVSLFDRMRAGLSKTQASLVGRIDTLLRGGKIDEELIEELEEVLITADFGMSTTQDLIGALEKKRARGEVETPEALRKALQEEIRNRLRLEAAPLQPESAKPFVIMVVGVNGVGKTTTIGKLARQFVDQGKKVVIGAGDTFRAAAAEQLQVWGERAGAEVVRHAEGADPAAVAFDAAKAALARKADILILDTAGRLHTKVNLMEELKKVRRVLSREIPDAPQETMLVLDATTGQNALVQAKLFQEAVEVTGITLTKLDGTARGGMIVAIGAELNLPVRYIGIGEGVEDLRPFDPDLFVEALFQKS